MIRERGSLERDRGRCGSASARVVRAGREMKRSACKMAHSMERSNRVARYRLSKVIM